MQKSAFGGVTTLPKQLAAVAYNRLGRVISRVTRFTPLGLPREQKCAFAQEVRDRYLSEWEQFFVGSAGHGDIECAGRYDGSPCPHAFRVSRATPSLLCQLQVDHEQELRAILDEWVSARQQLAQAPVSWTEGVEPGALCHLLCGLSSHSRFGEPFLRPRCRHCHVQMPHGRPHLKFVY